MTMSRDFIDSARAISTICCSATERSRTSAIGLQLEADALRDRARLGRHLAPVDEEAASPGSRPMKTFSAIVMSGASVNSW